MTNALKLLLLGIALMLFGLAFPGSIESLILRSIPRYVVSQTIDDLLASIFPIAGLTVAFVGFFKRD